MTDATLLGLKLGQVQEYVDEYDASLLQAIPRLLSRQSLACKSFCGEDVWTAYELSWLDDEGRPVVAVAEFHIPAASPNIVESKSFKYYLNSFNQTRFASDRELKSILIGDLSVCTGAEVRLELFSLEAFFSRRTSVLPMGVCLDSLPVGVAGYEPRQSILQLSLPAVDELEVNNVWVSHLLKSNCPVTGQPDWASIWIGIEGRALVPESLLRYIISYRKHQDFHENCVERIFNDLLEVCAPKKLWVYARYTRRGGLDINPFRSLHDMTLPNVVGARQ